MTKQKQENPEPESDNRVVAYLGSADSKMLTPPDFASVGVPNQALAIEWNRGNNHRVPADHLSEEAIAWLVAQSDFAIEG